MTTSHAVTRLEPAMAASGPPRWPGARWIGAIDVGALARAESDVVTALDAEGYHHARILVRDGVDVLGFVEVAVSDGRIDPTALADAAAQLPRPVRSTHEIGQPPMTVAVSTRDRADNLPNLIATLLRLDYPDYDILIVDNDPSEPSAVVEYVQELGDPRVRAVHERRPGVSRGRNRAMVDATHEIIAFTDDDGAADPLWLQGIARGFASAPDVALVTGMVPSGELTTPAQGYFERRINWELTARSRVFRVADRPEDIPLFPFEVSVYGTGANFAVRRDLALRLGGMSEALGAGSPAGGGEDIDFFVRALYAGAALAYESSAIVWHRHRPESSALQGQLASYGRGMGAWITSVLGSRQTRADAIRLLAGVLRRLPALGSSSAAPHADTAVASGGATGPVVAADGAGETGIDDSSLRWVEVRGMAAGPWCYLRSRRDDRVIRPLTRR